jgi:hypothetical protein
MNVGLLIYDQGKNYKLKTMWFLMILEKLFYQDNGSQQSNIPASRAICEQNIQAWLLLNYRATEHEILHSIPLCLSKNLNWPYPRNQQSINIYKRKQKSNRQKHSFKQVIR